MGVHGRSSFGVRRRRRSVQLDSCERRTSRRLEIATLFAVRDNDKPLSAYFETTGTAFGYPVTKDALSESVMPTVPAARLSKQQSGMLRLRRRR